MAPINELFERLKRTLDLEYNALLAGDLDEVVRTSAEKAQILDEVGRYTSPEMGVIAPLRAKLLRNQTLTQSALEGMRKAIFRMKEIKDVTSVLRTYRSDGRKSGVPMRVGLTLSKRS